MKKKIISILLSLGLIVSLLPAISVTAAADCALTSGATIQSGVTYTISDAAELGYLAAVVNGGQNCVGATFQLLNDIDLNSGYTFTYNAGGYVSAVNGAELFRIGAGGTGYAEGHYYTVAGAEISAGIQGSGATPFYVEGTDTVSFFLNDNRIPDYILSAWIPIGNNVNKFSGTFDGGGHTVSGMFINRSGPNDHGLFGCIGNGAAVQNLIVDGLVMGNGSTGSITGSADNSSISNCTSTCIISGGNGATGGICGYAYQTAIGSCTNTGAVNGIGSVGGIVGAIAVGSVTHCVNSGSIYGSSDIGGIAGASQVTIVNCYNRGSVSTAIDYSGGIAGNNYGLVINCYNTGSVTDQDPIQATNGGLVGDNIMIGAVKNSYWLSGTANNAAGVLNPGTYLSGCGTFVADGTITAGTAANCVAGQTLFYGDSLLDALNKWVVSENSASYREWTADTGNTNDGYPVFGALHLQKVITQQPASSNNYTMSTTDVPGIIKTPQWYKFTAAAAAPDMDVTKVTPGWDILSARRPDGFGMAVINYNYAWTSLNGVYTSGNGGHGNSYSAMSIPVTVAGGNDISFEWKVSSELGCDFLYGGLFQYNGASGQYELVGGTSISSINGEVGWTPKTYSSLPDGTYYLAFLFSKDPGTNTGSDCGQVRLVGTDEILPSQITSTLDTVGVTPGERFRCRMSYSDGIILFSDSVMFLLPSTVPDVTSATVAKTAAIQTSVSYTLTTPLAGTWIVYNALTDGSLVAGVTASAAGTTLTLTHAADIPVGTYFVSLTEAGKAESARLALTVTPYIAPVNPPVNPPTNPPAVIPSSSGVDIIVNGNKVNAGTASDSTEGGKTVTTITVDQQKLDQKLVSEGNNALVIIPSDTNSDKLVGQLNGQMIRNMEDKQATLEVQTGSASYTLPASEINIDAVSAQLGTDVTLSNITVQIAIASPSDQTVTVVKSAAEDGGFSVVVPAVDFNINCTYGGKTVNVSNFNAYVERKVAIPDGADPTKITTGIVVSPNGTLRHVPTKVTIIDGKYYAVINSLTNSTYTVVWHPIEFSDVTASWAKDSINDMGSRMVVQGVGDNKYAPNRDITRAEFAAIVVRALGLAPGVGANSFNDVTSVDWYCGYVETAAAYGIIFGYNTTTFGPKDTITREQAMTMIARAMKITGLKPAIADDEISTLLAKYSDGTAASDYAKTSIAACLKTGIITGRSSTTIAPKNYITRAEVAVIVQRLLKKSDLI